ncbi:hypothetical protein HPB48_017598 [Haemaphysalis longicornis]|uniref:HSF-type DNA-binding domain-containing protein n=1 Tax=Haemaphysalis longicornis TaxID=44386 RepID=A0A9J6GME2_HAELO|nr:hypothetical protein HPB48_017598 [Haemaphysalis longicornis]
MDPADEPEDSQLSPSSSKDQSLRTLSFPNKLWKIINECRSGAICWTTDGTAVAINYAKFQSDYLENRLDIFKTNNITSFIRQLNLYGFRMVSPQYRVTMGNPERPDLHVFRNDFFLRGRPDLLQLVTRKTGALRAKMSQRDDGAGAGPSSGRQQNGHADGSHGGRNQGNALPRHKHAAVKRPVDRQRRDGQVGAIGGPSPRPPAAPTFRVNGPPLDMQGGYGYNANYWDSMLWSSQESTSETESSDEEDDYSPNSGTEEEPTSAASAGSSTSVVSEEAVVDYDAEDSFVDGLIQRTIGRNEGTSDNCAREMALLLDPNQPPSVVLMFHGAEEAHNLMPSIEEYLRVDPGIRPVGESSDEEDAETSS